MTELRRVPLDDVRAARDRHQVPSGVLVVPGSLSEAEVADLATRFFDGPPLAALARGGLICRPTDGSWWRRTICRWTA
jgi:hypothetical protein